ncbi:MAG: oligosaccharide flippase family protein [Solirubrobacterales bacterium]|nr:oligosaccharide flippase family protein [Solirubrobacterales bacterium]
MSEQGDVKGLAVRGAALLSIRQILVGLVTVAGIITLPLLLSPAEFSLYGYVNTVVLVGAALGDLGLGAYLIKKRATDRDIAGSFALQLAFWLPASLLALALAIVLDPFGFSTLTSALLLLALLLLALQALPTALLEKEMAFKRISAVEVVQRIVLVTIAITLAVVDPAQWSIPVAAAAAALVGYPAMMVAARWRWLPRFAPGEPLFRGFSSQWWQARIANQASYAAYPLLGGLLFTASEVGLIVWALAITSIPTYLAPMVSRATYPALARSSIAERVSIFSNLFRSLLLFGAPLLAGLIVAAEPLTLEIFGDAWADGVPLLRLESITSFIGIGLNLLMPLMFLTAPPARIKWMTVGNTAGIVLLSLVLAPLISFKAISVATIVTGLVLLVSFDRIVRREIAYSPVRDMLPAGAGLILAVAVCLPAALEFDSLAGGLAAGVLAAVIQLATTWGLKGGINLKTAISRIRPAETAVAIDPVANRDPADDF